MSCAGVPTHRNGMRREEAEGEEGDHFRVRTTSFITAAALLPRAFPSLINQSTTNVGRGWERCHGCLVRAAYRASDGR